MHIPQHGVGIAFRPAHDRGDEFGLMLDQPLHVGVGKERRQPDRGEHAVVEIQNDARDERQAAVSFEHRAGGLQGHAGARIFHSKYHAFSTRNTTLVPNHFPRRATNGARSPMRLSRYRPCFLERPAGWPAVRWRKVPMDPTQVAAPSVASRPVPMLAASRHRPCTTQPGGPGFMARNMQIDVKHHAPDRQRFAVVAQDLRTGQGRPCPWQPFELHPLPPPPCRRPRPHFRRHQQPRSIPGGRRAGKRPFRPQRRGHSREQARKRAAQTG